MALFDLLPNVTTEIAASGGSTPQQITVSMGEALVFLGAVDGTRKPIKVGGSEARTVYAHAGVAVNVRPLTGRVLVTTGDAAAGGAAVVLPTLTLTGPLTYTTNAAAGMALATGGGFQSGETFASVTPGQLAVNATQLLVGMGAQTAGSLAFVITTSLGRTISGAVTVTAGVVMLPTLTTSDASYHAVYATERLMPAYSGPTAQFTRISDGVAVPLGAGADGITANDIATLNGAGVATDMGRLYDQTGSGRDAVQATSANMPQVDSLTTLSGRLAIQMAGISQSRNLGFTHSLDAQSMTFFGIAAARSSNATNPLLNYFSGGDVEYAGSASGNVRWYADASAQMYFSALVASSPMPFVLVLMSTGAKLFIDGKVLTATKTRGSLPVTTGRIARSNSADLRALVLADGYINKAVNDTDAAAILLALQQRYGLATTYDANVLISGDSIFAGTGASSNNFRNVLFYALPNLSNKVRVYNGSTASIKLAQLYAGRANFEGVAYSAGTKNVVVIQAAINDLGGDASLTAATLYSNTLTPYVQYLKGLGYKVVVCKVLPTTSTGYADTAAGIETRRNDYNALIASNAAGADVICDYASNATIGTYPDSPNNGTYYGDKLHPTSASCAIMGPILAAAINAAIALA